MSVEQAIAIEEDLDAQEQLLRELEEKEVQALQDIKDELEEEKKDPTAEAFESGLQDLVRIYGSDKFEDGETTTYSILQQPDGRCFMQYEGVAYEVTDEKLQELLEGYILNTSAMGNGGSVETIFDQKDTDRGIIYNIATQGFTFVGEKRELIDEELYENREEAAAAIETPKTQTVEVQRDSSLEARSLWHELFGQQEVTEQLVQEWPLDITQTTQSEQAMAEALVLFPPTLPVVTAQGIEATPMTEVLVQMQEAAPGAQVVLPYRMEQVVPQGGGLISEAMVFERHETGIHVSFVEAQPPHFGGVEYTAMVTHEVITQEKSEAIEAVTVLAPPTAEAVRMDTVLSEPSLGHEESDKPMVMKVEMPVANLIAWNEFKPSAPDVLFLSEQVMPPVLVAAPAVESQTQAVFPTVLPSPPASENEFKITATGLTPTIVLSPSPESHAGSADEVYNVSEKQSVEGAVTIPTSEVVAPVAAPETASSVVETVSPALSSSETLIIATALEAENPAAISTSSPEDVITHQPTTAIQTAGAVQQPQEKAAPIDEITRNEQVGITTIVEKPEEQAGVAETVVNEVAAVTETVTTLEQQPGTSVAVERATVTEIIDRSEAVVAEIVETPGTEVVSSSFESRSESVPRYVSEPVIANEQPRARRVIRITAAELVTPLVPADEDTPTRLTVERSQRPRPAVGNSPSLARRATTAAINAASQAIAA